MQHLWAALGRHRGLTATALLAGLVSIIFDAAIPLLTRDAIDTATGVRTPSSGTDSQGWFQVPDTIHGIIIILLIIAVVKYAGHFTRRLTAGWLAYRIQHDLRMAVLANLQRLDPPARRSLGTGQVVSRTISDLGQIQRLLGMAPLGLSMVVHLVLVIVIMVTISPLLTVVTLALVPLIVWAAARSRKALYGATWLAQAAGADVATHVEETVTGVRIVKAFHQSDAEVERNAALGRTLYSLRMRAARLNARFQPVLEQLPQVSVVIVVLVGGMLVMRESLSVGTFFAFSVYLNRVTDFARVLASMVVRFYMGRASIDRIADLLDARPVHPFIESDTHTAARGTVEVSVERLGLSPTLVDTTLKLPAGEVTALVGPPGCGKTLLARLIAGLDQPDAGRILFSGRDLRDFNEEELRQLVSFVPDEPFLYSGSIAHNIAMATGASQEEIENAAKIACASEFIDRLDDGYETIVGERGLTLSGGQRQRIALARALLARPKVLLLDDATSAIDAATEAQIVANLRAELRGVTILAVAHRHSTLDLAQHVALMDEGRIITCAPLAELEQHPGYQQLMGFRELTTPAVPDDHLHDPNLPSHSATHEHNEPSVDHDVSDEQLWPHPSWELEEAHYVGIGAAPPPPGVDTRIPEEVLQEKPREPILQDTFSMREMLSSVRGLIASVAALLIIGVVMDLSFPTLIRWALDHGVAKGEVSVLWWLSLTGLIVIAIAWGAAAWRTVLAAKTGEGLLYQLRLRSYAHLQSLSMSYFETHLSGRIMTRMTTDVDNLAGFLQTGLAQTVVSAGTLIGILVMLGVTAPSLALIAAGFLPIVIIATIFFRRYASRLYTRAREEISQVNATFQEAYNGAETTQLHLMGTDTYEQLQEESLAYVKSRITSQALVAAYFPGLGFLSDIARAVVLGAGATMISDGQISTGVMIAFLLYLAQLFGPIQQLGQIFDTWQQASVSLTRIRELLAEEPTVEDTGRRTDAAERASEDLTLNNVSFAYGQDLPEVTHDMELLLPAGSTTALVGPTGAGKSTVIKLLARFYDPARGSVEAGKVNICEFPIPHWRAQLAMVPQEPHLFQGTVASNIAYGRPDASRAEIIAAIRRVGAAEVLAQLPQGVATQVNERGQGLSSGQRQLIALARAELIEPRVLLLDEATATLDPATEAQVLSAAQKITDSALQPRTSVIVAHRLATAERADHVVVIDHGRIIESGSPATLAANPDSAYTKLRRAAGMARAQLDNLRPTHKPDETSGEN